MNDIKQDEKLKTIMRYILDNNNGILFEMQVASFTNTRTFYNITFQSSKTNIEKILVDDSVRLERVVRLEELVLDTSFMKTIFGSTLTHWCHCMGCEDLSSDICGMCQHEDALPSYIWEMKHIAEIFGTKLLSTSYVINYLYDEIKNKENGTNVTT